MAGVLVVLEKLDFDGCVLSFLMGQNLIRRGMLRRCAFEAVTWNTKAHRIDSPESLEQ